MEFTLEQLINFCGINHKTLTKDLLVYGFNGNKSNFSIGEVLFFACKNILEQSGVNTDSLVILLHEFKDIIINAGKVIFDALINEQELPAVSLDIIDGRYVSFTDVQYFFNLEDSTKLQKIDFIPCLNYSLLITGLFVKIIRSQHEYESQHRDRKQG